MGMRGSNLFVKRCPLEGDAYHFVLDGADTGDGDGGAQ
jgi:hypothetical protein